MILFIAHNCLWVVVLIGHKLANHHESNLTNKENYSKLVNSDIVYFCSEILWYTISYYAVWLDHDLYIILHPTHGHQWILLLQSLRLPGSEESVWISVSYFCSCYYHYKSQSYKVSFRNLLIWIANFENFLTETKSLLVRQWQENSLAYWLSLQC